MSHCIKSYYHDYIQTQHTDYRRSRIHRQPRGSPLREQVSGIPHHQPGQADVCRELGEPEGHRGQGKLCVRKSGHLRLRKDAGSDAAVSRGRHHPPGGREPCGPQHQGPVHLCTHKRNGYAVSVTGGQGVLGKSAGEIRRQALLPHLYRRGIRCPETDASGRHRAAVHYHSFVFHASPGLRKGFLLRGYEIQPAQPLLCQQGQQ